MSLLKLSKFQADQLENEENRFHSEIFSDLEKSEIAFNELDSLFKESTPKKDRDLLFHQFRWYALLLWSRLGSFTSETVINVAYGRQIPAAIILDFDVLRELMWYLATKASYYLPAERQTLYSKIRQAFFESSAIVGELKGKEYSVKEVVAEARRILRQPQRSSLDVANLHVKIKSLLFPNNELAKKFFFADPEVGSQRFFELTEFFLDVEPENINELVEIYTHPKIVASEENKSVDYKEIKAHIEAKFKKDTNGQFVDLEGVHNELQSIANEENDERIRDLYFFNEQTGKFEWNDKLIEEEGYVGTK